MPFFNTNSMMANPVGAVESVLERMRNRNHRPGELKGHHRFGRLPWFPPGFDFDEELRVFKELKSLYFECNQPDFEELLQLFDSDSYCWTHFRDSRYVSIRDIGTEAANIVRSHMNRAVRFAVPLDRTQSNRVLYELDLILGLRHSNENESKKKILSWISDRGVKQLIDLQRLYCQSASDTFRSNQEVRTLSQLSDLEIDQLVNTLNDYVNGKAIPVDVQVFSGQECCSEAQAKNIRRKLYLDLKDEFDR